MSDEPVDPPRIPLPTETLVQEKATQQQLLWIDGLLPLPIGSRINLGQLGQRLVPIDPARFPSGMADAVVVNVRLWGPHSPARCLVLEVELTEPGDEGGWMVQD
jgi:hypothetical protein